MSRLLENYQNINSNDPAGYNPDEWEFRRIKRNSTYFKEKDDEEKWRHELKMQHFPLKWFQDR